MKKSNDEKKGYLAPVVKSVSFKVEKGFDNSQSLAPLQFDGGPEAYQQTTNDNLDGNIFGFGF